MNTDILSTEERVQDAVNELNHVHENEPFEAEEMLKLLVDLGMLNRQPHVLDGEVVSLYSLTSFAKSSAMHIYNACHQGCCGKIARESGEFVVEEVHGKEEDA